MDSPVARSRIRNDLDFRYRETPPIGQSLDVYVNKNVNLLVRSCKDKGNCLYSDQYIKAGTCIVNAPAYCIDKAEVALIRNCDLYKYVFYDASIRKKNEQQAEGFFVFGAVSFCSHSNTPNAEVVWSSNEACPLIHLISLRPIMKREEITIRYANIDEYADSKNWIS